MVLDGGNCTFSGPVNITNLEVVSALNVVGAWANNESEVLFNELVLSECAELVDSLFIGSEFVGVVGVDFGKVLEEDLLSVDVLEFGGEDDSEFGLPGFELRNLGGGLLVEEHSGSTEDCQKDGELLSVHRFNYELFNLLLIYRAQ